ASAAAKAGNAGPHAGLEPPDSGATGAHQERHRAKVSAASAGSAARHSQPSECAKEYAGIGAQPASERSELYARHERRGQDHAARLGSPARPARPPPAERLIASGKLDGSANVSPH